MYRKKNVTRNQRIQRGVRLPVIARCYHCRISLTGSQSSNQLAPFSPARRWFCPGCRVGLRVQGVREANDELVDDVQDEAREEEPAHPTRSEVAGDRT